MYKDLIHCGHTLFNKKLVWGHSGNISARIEPNVFLISAGGTDLGNLKQDDLLRCLIDSEKCENMKSPSMETGLHKGIYRSFTEALAVIHSQPFYSTIVACSNMEIKTDFLPEAMAYLINIERVPYHHAGSVELARATAAKAQTSHVLLLENHGVICWGASLDEALLMTETLEFVCRLLVTSRQSNVEFNYLGEQVVDDFRQHLRKMGRLK
ncbi:MAG: class II aldolase/adducin family protein [Chloroflexi bacterium]|jgi:3-dehydro-4-phosphotetronate decarboxylase|nr:class II aldolase/adducin family protein [Chloroflexota bacterium]